MRIAANNGGGAVKVSPLRRFTVAGTAASSGARGVLGGVAGDGSELPAISSEAVLDRPGLDVARGDREVRGDAGEIGRVGIRGEGRQAAVQLGRVPDPGRELGQPC